MAKRVKIPGRLESAETGNIVTGADAVMDDEKGKTQVVINSEVDAAIINLAQGKQDNLTFDSEPTEGSPNPVTSAGVYTADKVLSDAIEAILLLIPSAASALNKLVDMQTMNSSIATATASFKGTYNLVSDLHLGVDATHEQIGAALDALSLDADNNDYAFVQVPNSATAPTEIRKTERYKYNGTNWLFEYDLNNSGFTQGQWNAINSGVTSLLVGKLSDLPTNAELTTLLAGKQDNLTFDNVPTAGSPNPVKSGGVYARNNEIVALINALDAAKQDVLTFDNAPVQGSPNPVKSGGVYTAISAVQAAIVALDAAKQNVLTFDSTPTLGSPNPVTSSGIKTELNRIDGNITTLNDLYEALTQSALVIVQPSDTWPVASPATKTIYRVVDRVNTPPQYYSDYMWNGTAMVLMATYDNAIEDVPTAGSDNLVKSDGIFRQSIYNSGFTGIADYIENGSCGNEGNQDVIRTSFIPLNGITPGHEIVINTNRPNTTGYHYIYGYCLITSEKDLGKTVPNRLLEGDFYNVNYEYTRDWNYATVPSDGKTYVGIAVVLGEYNGTNVHSLRKTDFDGYQITLSCGVQEQLYGTKELTFMKNKVQIYSLYDRYLEVEESWPDDSLYIHDTEWICRVPYMQNKTNAQLAAEMGVEVYTSPKGYPNCIKIPAGYNLVADLYIGKTLLSIQSRDINDNKLVLLSNSSGCLVKVSDVLVGGLIRTINTDLNSGIERNFDIYYQRCRTYLKNHSVDDLFSVSYSLKPNDGEIQVESASIEATLSFIALKSGDTISGQIANYATYDILCVYDKNFRPIKHILSQGSSTFIDVSYTALDDCYVRFSKYDSRDLSINYNHVVSLNEKINSSKETFYDGTEEVKKRFHVNLRNGSLGNEFNVNGVTTEIVPTTIFKNFSLVTNRPNRDGCHYTYLSRGYSIERGFPSGRNTDKITERHDYSNYNDHVSNMWEKTSTNSKGWCFTLWEINNSDGSFVPLRLGDFEGYEVYIECDGLFGVNDDVVGRNTDKMPMLTASCRYRKSGNTSKDFQMLIVTDSHNDNVVVQNAIDATNGFAMIDAVIHCGDVADNIRIGLDYSNLWKNIANYSSKPYYFVIGNHEAGNYLPLIAHPSKTDLYNNFIKPSVDGGHLRSGEYQVGRCYYYHDFTAHNIRLIVLDEYETPTVIDETYWRKISYNSSLPNYTENTNYSAGAQVNVANYTDFSFEAVQNLNTGGFYDSNPKVPRVAYRNDRWITQTQAQWFLDTLLSTPENYQVIVACHNPFSLKADVVQTVKFSQKNGWTDGHGTQTWMTTDFIAEAINAFANGSNFSITCESSVPSVMPSYTVAKDFSGKSSGVSFHSLVGGHVHQDCVWKHQVYNQYQITPICANTNYWPQCPNADIRRPSSDVVNELDTDCLTVVSYGAGRLGLVKLGVNVTETGEKRDYEVININ